MERARCHPAPNATRQTRRAHVRARLRRLLVPAPRDQSSLGNLSSDVTSKPGVCAGNNCHTLWRDHWSECAIPVADQLPQHSNAPARGNRKDTELRGDQRPQHAPLPPFLPRRLINIQITTLHVDSRFFDRWRNGLRHRLFNLTNLSQRQLNALTPHDKNSRPCVCSCDSRPYRTPPHWLSVAQSTWARHLPGTLHTS